MIDRRTIETVVRLVMQNYTVTDDYLRTTPSLDDIADRVEAEMIRKIGYAKEILAQFEQ